MIYTILITPYDRQCNYHYVIYCKALKTNIKNTLESLHFPTAGKANRCKKWNV